MADELTIIPRSTTGLVADYEAIPVNYGWDKVIVHWNGPAVKDTVMTGHALAERAFLRGVEKYHLDKRNSRGQRIYSGIAYNEAIGPSGDLYELRGDRRSGAHSGDLEGDGVNENREGYAIFLMLGEGQKPTQAMLDTLLKRLDQLGLPPFGHREIGEQGRGTATSCPGPDVLSWVQSLRRGTAHPAPGETAPAPAPSEPVQPASEGFDVTKLPIVRRDERGRPVKAVQGLMNASGLASTRVDGIFGPKTQAAVERFQRAVGAQVDGIVGPETWGHLLNVEA